MSTKSKPIPISNREVFNSLIDPGFSDSMGKVDDEDQLNQNKDEASEHSDPHQS